MKLLDKLRNRSAAAVHDLAMIPVAWLGAYWLRFNLDSIPEPYMNQALLMLPVVVLIHASVFLYFGLYRGVWRFASVPDLLRIGKAVVIATAISAVAIFMLTRMDFVPRSVIPLSALLLVFLLGGPRFLYRWMKDRRLYELPGKKALIVGAGRAGEMLVRDMLRDPQSEYQPVAFVDDDGGKRGREIHGVRVAGSVERMPRLVSRFEIAAVLIAVPSATSKQMRRIVDVCESCNVPVRTLPRIGDLVGGQISIKEMRDVRIEDLLGREAVKLDWPAISNGVGGKTVLITGGGGSIGSELCRQVASVDPKKLIVLDHSEFNLFTIDLELARKFPNLDRVMVLGDVCDTAGVSTVLQAHAPDVIFHAAAYKHVPMLENQVRAAVWNNVIGTWTVAALAGQYRCGTFVLISSDKAVNPTNVMGASKRAAEICCRYFDGQSETRYLTVRFGNVLGSTGSVIPLFREQIARGGPVTVTDPQISRYFMTTAEATQLILQASVIGKGGEIFVLDMGEPIKIAYLARQLILLSGRKPDEDIEIVYTGLRPGEKLYEELFHEDEERVDTEHPKILLARSRTVRKLAVEKAISEFRTASMNADEVKIKEILRTLVPEHASADVPGVAVADRAQRLAT